MPIFIAALGGMLINICGYLAGRVLIALGFAVITYTGLSAGLEALKTQAITAFMGLPPEIFQILSMMKVGTCISILTSAISARMLLNGIQGDTFKRWVLK